MRQRKVADRPEIPPQERFAGLAGCGKRVAEGSVSSAKASRDRVISLIRNRLTVGFHPVTVMQTLRNRQIIKIYS